MSDLTQRLAELSPAKRKLLMDRMQQKAAAAEPIAVVGMACRFPGAPSVAAFWRLVQEGIDATGEIPASRWDVEEFYDPTGEQTGKTSTRWGGFLDDVDLFDPQFFGITPREAARMDPQQRLLLEVAWEAFEMAGLAGRIGGSATGVFIGIGGTDYSKIPAQFDDYFHHIDAHVGTGNALSIAANRLSYIFDLHGPSLAVDTACSSSTMGVHLAIQSLRNRECDAALAGGVNCILTPETTIAFSKARMLSPDGCCRPFDANANGYVRGEGCAIIVLKRLTDAVRDSDPVLAVIRASAVNQDGRTSGITAPNGLSQQAVIRAALVQAGLSPEQVSYIEAHGTGTPLGDPIEIDALSKIFVRRSPADPPVYVTSLKANVGHMETVSGVAGILKVILMMQHGQIPPQLHLKELNPRITLEGSRLLIPREPVPWTDQNGPRIAGVSSFGFGGANTHVILEAATLPTPAAPSGPERPTHLLALSAKTSSALKTLARRYAEFLEAHREASLAEVCYSAATGRAHFNHRLAVSVTDADGLRQILLNIADGKQVRGALTGQVKLATFPKVAMLFTGQGSQYVGMGRRLYETQPTFRRTLDQCDKILRQWLDEPLLSILYPEPGHSSPLDQTVCTQPALFALEYALATLWRSWGVQPDLVMGHSVGEYVAACVAGVFSLEDALHLIALRARLMQQLPSNGRMVVVFAPERRVAELIAPHADQVSIAAVNGPENTVVSGAAAIVERLQKKLESAGIGMQELNVSHAFHSPLMEPMLDEFTSVAGEIEFHKPHIPLVSNLTGRLLEVVPDANYWRDHIRSTVRFAESMATLADQEMHALVEAGPTASLLGMGRRCQPDLDVLWLPTLRKGSDDWQVLLESLSQLYVLGTKIDWQGFDRDWRRQRVALPSYPFERGRHWFEPGQHSRRHVSGGHGPSIHPLLGARIRSVWSHTLYEAQLSSRAPRYLADHVVQGSAVLPAAAYVEQALASAQQAFGPGHHVVENFAIQHAMFLSEGASRPVQVAVSPESGGTCTFETYSLPDAAEKRNGGWTLHACGQICHADARRIEAPPPVDFDQIRPRVVDTKTRKEFYELTASRGLVYGPAFQGLGNVERSHDAAIADVQLDPMISEQLDQYLFHPALCDACLQLVAGVVPLESDGSYSPYTYIPTAIRRVRLFGEVREPLKAFAVRTSPGDQPSPDTIVANVFLTDQQGNVVAEMIGMEARRLGRTAGGQQEIDVRDWLYRIHWQPAPLSAEAVTAQGACLIFTDHFGVGGALADALEEEGRRCVIVGSDDLDLLSADAYTPLLEQLVGPDESGPLDVVHCFALDAPAPDALCPTTFDEARRLGVASVLRLVQQMVRLDVPKPPALWIVTRGAQAVNSSSDPLSVAQAPLWGMGRVTAVEHPELRCRLIDLDAADDPTRSGQFLAQELRAASEENQIAYRDGQRHVARLQRARDATAASDDAATKNNCLPPAEGPFRLRFGEAGSFDSLRYEACSRRTPEEGQVEIEVHAAGLNFSDVLKVMGLYPGITDPVVPLGIECSGVVARVGKGVQRFRPGDEVMGVAPFSFASHAISAEYALVPKPKNISHDEAVTIPITFLTAYYGLHRLANIQPGEKVLIHAGAGGVGLAAVQIARHAGCEIFATAGSDEKREFLRSLGVHHVMNSRTLEFADQIMEMTGRRGIDVVLNSLPGEAIPKSLGCLAAYGRFLEIGKTDIYQNRMIGLLPFQNNLSYSAIDLDRMLRERPEYIREMFSEVMQYFRDGVYRPLPFSRFAVDQTETAFRYMAQRKNIGKVVVSMEDRPAPETAPDERPWVRTDASYLITGGLGALGLQMAEWLVEQGAKHVVLMSRRPAASETAEVIATLAQNAVTVTTIQGDVSDRSSLERALAQIPANFPPLAGVLHAAGVLDDGLMFDMDLDRLDRPMAPKTQGAWNLHEATRDKPLDFFVMFSSIACVLGSPGQANYAAGNAFLDALAQERRAQGLPATSINWGPWGGTGMAAEAGRHAQITSRGVELLPPDKSLGLLADLIRSDAAPTIVMWVRWPDLLRMSRDGTPPLVRDIAAAEGEAADVSGTTDSPEDLALRQELLSLELSARIGRLREYFTGQLSRIMGLEPENLDTEQPLNALGLDSLMAIELKNSIETRLKVVLPMARFMEGPSTATLARHVAEAMEEQDSQPTPLTLSVDAPSDGRYPLSRGQTALWFLYQLAPESSAYNICFAVRVYGDLDVDALGQAVQAIVDRHPAFRTTFHEEDGVPYQKIHARWPVPVERDDAAGWSQAEVDERIARETQTPFDLATGPLLRVRVLERGTREFVLVFSVHHTVADFWSLVACAADFRRLYEAARAGGTVELEPIRLQYTDFTQWQSEMLSGPEGEAHWEYWRRQLEGELPVLNLPTDRPRPPVQTYNGSLEFRSLDRELSDQLRQLGLRYGATMHVVLLAAYQILLHRYSGQDRILVGAPTSGRTRAEFAPVAGYFVNPVVISGDFTEDRPCSQFLEEIRDRMHGALDHQDYPFPLLVERLHPKRDPSHSPLVQAMFVMQKAQIMHEEGLTPFLMGQSGAKLEFAGLTFESMTLEQWVARFDLSLAASEATGGYSLAMQYNTDLFDCTTIHRMMDHYEQLLRSFVADPQTPLSQLSMLSPSEHRQMVVEWNETANPAVPKTCVHQGIEAQAARTPNEVAVVCDDIQLTYRELNRRANKWAHYLQSLGVGPDVRVGVCLGRSTDLLVAILAVLKAGGAYVPLDPNYPAKRLEDVAGRAGMSVVLTHQKHRAAIGAFCRHTLCLDAAPEKLARQSDRNPAPSVGPNNLAYVIYTSGSTGRPKGAGVYHRGVTNLLDWYVNEVSFTAADRSLVFTSPAFDLTQKNLFAALLVGGQVHLTAPEVYDPDHILQQIEHGRISVINCTPSHFHGLLVRGEAEDLDLLDLLRCVLLGGEPLDVTQLKKWCARDSFATELVNVYGPTECSAIAAFHRLVSPLSYVGRRVPIGRPIPNARLYITDKHLALVPVGVVGELCIAGAGVGAGYIDDEQLTAEKFCDDPFTQQEKGRLYRTGDLCRRLPDGTVEFLGRVDHQIKIRGFRVELGEIENTLKAHPAVRDAIVLAREDVPGNKRLVAYVLHPQEDGVETGQLSTWLRERLPDHMVPSAFLVLVQWPLTPHGKVDRLALPAPDTALEVGREYVAPETPNEQVLAEIWCEVLHLERVGIHDSFFELGGDSILSIQVVARLAARKLRCTPAQIFQHQTIAELAKVLDRTRAVTADQREVIGSVKLTPIQRRFFAQASPNVNHHNQSLLLEVPQRLDPRYLEPAVSHVLAHHDMLRARFERVDDDWQQTVGHTASGSATRIDLSGAPPHQLAERIEQHAAEAQRSLDLHTGRLFQAVVFDLGPDTPQRLLLVIHHLVVDGVSWRILLEDLLTAYEQLRRGSHVTLLPKTTSFRAWADRLSEYAQSDALAKEADYWTGVVDEPVSPFPVDHPADHATNSTCDHLAQTLDAAQTKALLREIPAAAHAQIQEVLVTALALAYRTWSGHEALRVDLEGHGREDLFPDVDVSRTVGWFTSVFPVTLRVERDWDEVETLRAIKDRLRSIPQHGVGYGVLRYLREQKDSRFQNAAPSPLVFNYLGQFDQAWENIPLGLRAARESRGPERCPEAPCPYLLEINSYVSDRRLHIEWTYSRKVYRAATVQRLADAFVEAIQRLIVGLRSAKTGQCVPSDFPLADLTQSRLNDISARHPRFEDVYPLAPAQMEFLAAADSEPGTGVCQLGCRLIGELDENAFRRVLEWVVQRHTILRTSFGDEDNGQPLQVVHGDVPLPLERYDWRSLSLAECEDRLAALRQAERLRGFDLKAAPPSRFVLARVAANAYQFLWTHHHLLLDGWSVSLILKEVFLAYEGVRQMGSEPPLPPARPFRDYLGWLRGQDAGPSETFWRTQLVGTVLPTELGLPARTNNSAAVLYPELDFFLSREETHNLQSVARRQRLTLNTLVQGAWAMLLGRRSGQPQVVYGSVVSGRPAGLDGVESMVGLFINTLPVVASVPSDDTLLRWLVDFQSRLADVRQHEHVPLANLRQWCGLGLRAPLFESLLAFENYPVASSLIATHGGSLGWDRLFAAEQWHYPLHVIIVPQQELRVRLIYDPRRFDEVTIHGLLDEYRVLLAELPSRVNA